MKERPILFNGDMVCSILDGCKTQTRRPVNRLLGRCPYGQAGDRLWVRETWTVRKQAGLWLEWKADLNNARVPDSLVAEAEKYISVNGWRPSIHMPRWASRLTLEITSVRVERLQDMTESDAIAEGFIGDEQDPHPQPVEQAFTALAYFSSYWNMIYLAKCSWDTNPWVWVVEFIRVRGDGWDEAGALP